MPGQRLSWASMTLAWQRPRGSDRLPLVDLISSPVARAAIAEVIEHLVRDMEAYGRAYGRRRCGEHRALLNIQPHEGAVFELEYGISCSWIPHREGNRWQWHRTLKQSRNDLQVSRHTAGAPPRHPISHLDGLDRLHHQAGEALAAVAPLAVTGGTP
jgi:hypothetical protein